MPRTQIGTNARTAAALRSSASTDVGAHNRLRRSWTSVGRARAPSFAYCFRYFVSDGSVSGARSTWSPWSAVRNWALGSGTRVTSWCEMPFSFSHLRIVTPCAWPWEKAIRLPTTSFAVRMSLPGRVVGM